jgi:hypothetical protein
VGLQPLTPHDLRDTAASLAVAAGANVKIVEMMLRHASDAITLDIYAGLVDGDLDTVPSSWMGLPRAVMGIQCRLTPPDLDEAAPGQAARPGLLGRAARDSNREPAG